MDKITYAFFNKILFNQRCSGGRGLKYNLDELNNPQPILFAPMLCSKKFQYIKNSQCRNIFKKIQDFFLISFPNKRLLLLLTNATAYISKSDV